MLLLVDPPDREPRRPERWRIPWRSGSRVGLASALLAVTITTRGPVGALAAFGAVCATAWAGFSSIDDPRGMKDHRQ